MSDYDVTVQRFRVADNPPDAVREAKALGKLGVRFGDPNLSPTESTSLIPVGLHSIVIALNRTCKNAQPLIITIIIITVFITQLLPKDTKRQVLLLQGIGRSLRYKT